jgi:hypothetical protein
VGYYHELAKLLDLMSGVVELIAAAIALATALALRRRISEVRRSERCSADDET